LVVLLSVVLLSVVRLSVKLLHTGEQLGGQLRRALVRWLLGAGRRDQRARLFVRVGPARGDVRDCMAEHLHEREGSAVILHWLSPVKIPYIKKCGMRRNENMRPRPRRATSASSSTGTPAAAAAHPSEGCRRPPAAGPSDGRVSGPAVAGRWPPWARRISGTDADSRTADGRALAGRPAIDLADLPASLRTSTPARLGVFL
jgi:hypothetical protein